jgi:DNA-binding transcriptional MocR family regulator
MDEIRCRLARAQKEATERLSVLGFVPWTKPKGGFYLWCRLPEGRNSVDLAKLCMEDKVVLGPGDVFSASQSATPYMRFNVAQMSDERIFKTIEVALSRCG